MVTRRTLLAQLGLYTLLPSYLFGSESATATAFAHERELDEAVHHFMKMREIPGGSLAIMKDGHLEYERSFGFRDLEAKLPVTNATRFRLASLSKPITSVAILQLCEKKRLSLKDRVIRYLDIPHMADPRWEEITILQLLQHSGGWDRGISGDPMFQTSLIIQDLGLKSPPSFQELIAWVAKKPLDFAPGTRMAYSNFGYCLLGRVIEAVTQKPYETWVLENVLKPLGISKMKLGRSIVSDREMGESQYHDPASGKVPSLFSGEKVAVPDGGFHLESMDAHGGWIADATETAQFVAKIGGNTHSEVLQDHARLFEKPDFEGNKTRFYAAGWSVVKIDETKMNVFHQGSLPGSLTWMVHRADGWSWSLLFNRRSNSPRYPDGEMDQTMHRILPAQT